jgi:hypothetical protein
MESIIGGFMNFRCGICTTNVTTGVRTCTYSNVVKREFFPRCPKINQLCSGIRGAFVPAITVCRQRLF